MQIMGQALRLDDRGTGEAVEVLVELGPGRFSVEPTRTDLVLPHQGGPDVLVEPTLNSKPHIGRCSATCLPTSLWHSRAYYGTCQPIKSTGK